MSTEEFDPQRLTLARWSAGLSKRDLADRIGISPASVSQYEASNTIPSAPVIRQLAFAMGVPAEYLYSGANRRRPRLDGRSFFRSLRSTRQWQRDQADAIAEHLYDLVNYLDSRLRMPGVAIPTIPLSIDGPSHLAIETAAREVREAWELPIGPVSHVVRLLELHGAFVSRMPGIARAVDAFSRWFDRRPIVLLSAEKQDKGRSRFDAAHELGHLVLHHEPEPGDRNLERQAHAFAAAFLMPRDQVEPSLPRRVTRPGDWEALFEARSRWGVSASALLYRARELDVLTDASFRRAMTGLSKKGLRRDEGQALGDPEEPLLIHEALARVENDLGTSLAEIAAALRFNPRQLSDILGQSTELSTNRKVRASSPAFAAN